MFTSSDILFEISLHLSNNALVKCSTVNSSFNKLYNYEYFWKCRCINEIVIPEYNYKQKYIQMLKVEVDKSKNIKSKMYKDNKKLTSYINALDFLHQKLYKDKYILFYTLCNLRNTLNYNTPYPSILFIEIEFLHCYQLNIKKIPHQIIILSKLRGLDFSYSQIKEIPKEICLLQNLCSIDLSHNKLEDIPKEICQLQNLKNLKLHHNQIKQIPTEINMLDHLIVFDINNNQLTKLPDEICYMKKLSHLSIENNQINQLPKEFESLISRLITFGYYNNPFGDISGKYTKVFY